VVGSLGKSKARRDRERPQEKERNGGPTFGGEDGGPPEMEGERGNLEGPQK
jgi:hypothetical protein